MPVRSLEMTETIRRLEQELSVLCRQVRLVQQEPETGTPQTVQAGQGVARPQHRPRRPRPQPIWPARLLTDQLAALADLLSVLQAKLLLAIQRRLTPTAYAYDDHVPPVACSPCGVIRMASPLVPRGA